MKETSSFKANLRLLLAVFLLWIVCLVFVSFTAAVALDLPDFDDSITRFVRNRANPAILFWPWVAAAMIAYIVGPVALVVIFACIVIKKLSKA